jgi:exopolysaccharide biosynthesis polyprenyl glycosylphosphotransferase
VQRALVRVVVLLLADLAAFGVVRGMVRGVRDLALLGDWIARPLQQIMPVGILSGWQFAAAMVAGLLVTGNYSAGDNRRDPGRLFLACALATALPLWMTIWTRGVEVVALQYTMTLTVVWLALTLERQLVDRLVSRVRRAGHDAADTIFVGHMRDCQAVAASPAFRSSREFQPMGFVDVERPTAIGALGHIEELPLLLAASGAEVVVVCGAVRRPELQVVVDAALASGCQVLAVPPEANLPGVEPAVVWREGSALVRLTAPSLRGQQLFLKRVLDLAGAVAGLIVLSPVFALIAALIKLDSPGPVFFRQVRVGLGGRAFSIAKFRTMRVGADDEVTQLRSQSIYSDGRLFKVREDPRVTRLGRWLRRTSLDELPQLLNVLRGDMALVGPRPPVPSEVELYEEHHYARFDVKPGMTGPWQVSGRNEISDFEEVVKLETQYIREWTLLSDIVILARTVRAVFGMRGAH